MTFDVSRNCHKVSQGAVMKQERQSATLTFIFVTFLKKASQTGRNVDSEIILNLRRIPRKQFVIFINTCVWQRVIRVGMDCNTTKNSLGLIFFKFFPVILEKSLKPGYGLF